MVARLTRHYFIPGAVLLIVGVERLLNSYLASDLGTRFVVGVVCSVFGTLLVCASYRCGGPLR